MITNNVEEAILLSDRIVPMSAGPGATLGEPVVVSLPRPRSLSQLMHDQHADRVRAHVIECLTQNINGSSARRRPARPRAEPAVALAEGK
jgi:nitrate/nitrite transport system ATP-binding protein